MNKKVKLVILVIIAIVIAILVFLGIKSIIYNTRLQNANSNSIINHEEIIINETSETLSNNIIEKEIVISYLADSFKTLKEDIVIELNITKNDFKYNPFADKAPTVTLKIYDEKDNELKNIVGFEYIKDLGFNITEFEGQIKIINDTIKNNSKETPTVKKYKLLIQFHEHEDKSEDNLEHEIEDESDLIVNYFTASTKLLVNI